MLIDGALARTTSSAPAGAVIHIVRRVAAVSPALGAQHPGSTPSSSALRVLYEDEHMACIVKPQGLASMGGGPDSVQARLLASLAPAEGVEGALRKPHIVSAHGCVCARARACVRVGGRHESTGTAQMLLVDGIIVLCYARSVLERIYACINA